MEKYVIILSCLSYVSRHFYKKNGEKFYYFMKSYNNLIYPFIKNHNYSNYTLKVL